MAIFKSGFFCERSLLAFCLLSTVYCFKRAAKPVLGNGCPESAPWPCKTPGRCLSFDFICDGETDCPDKYDEDPALCTAKERPPVILLQPFIEKWKFWLIPDILGAQSVEKVATELIESRTIDDYAQAMELTKPQYENLKKLMLSVKLGRQVDLLLMGMPENAWNELYLLFGRIVKSGFLG